MEQQGVFTSDKQLAVAKERIETLSKAVVSYKHAFWGMGFKEIDIMNTDQIGAMALQCIQQKDKRIAELEEALRQNCSV